MELLWILAGATLLILGLIGSVLPVLPGPPLAYAGFLCLWPLHKLPGWGWTLGLGLLTLAVTLLDYVVPLIGAKRFKSSKWGERGSFIGTLVGLFFLPAGLLLGPFLGAMFGELIAKRPIDEAANSGLGAMLGVLSGILVKLLTCLVLGLAFILCL